MDSKFLCFRSSDITLGEPEFFDVDYDEGYTRVKVDIYVHNLKVAECCVLGDQTPHGMLYKVGFRFFKEGVLDGQADMSTSRLMDTVDSAFEFLKDEAVNRLLDNRYHISLVTDVERGLFKTMVSFSGIHKQFKFDKCHHFETGCYSLYEAIEYYEKN